MLVSAFEVVSGTDVVVVVRVVNVVGIHLTDMDVNVYHVVV